MRFIGFLSADGKTVVAVDGSDCYWFDVRTGLLTQHCHIPAAPDDPDVYLGPRGKVLAAIGARVVDRELPIPEADEALGEDGLPRERDAREALSATLDELLELVEPSAVAA